MLSVRLVGPFEAKVEEVPLPAVRYQASLKLFALLVLGAGQALPRTWLASQLWPERDETNALFYLRRALSGLRGALGAEADRLETPTPRTLRFRLDGVVFEELAGATLLAGWEDEWVVEARTKRAEEERTARRRLAERELPVPLTALRGRGELLKSVLARLAQGRLVTLLGPGGVGKTRLALEATRRLRGERGDLFPDGGAYVDLTLLPEGASEAQVAELLGTRLGLERPDTATLAAHLRSSRLLLTLDNAEHVLPSTAAVVARLLSAGEGLRVLVTSREPLGVLGEARVAVGPLGLDESMALFVERAQEANDTFQAEPQALIPLCSLLEGVPLALEMAAAWSAQLPLAELTERLRTHLPELADAQVRPDRHASLGAALAWSVSRLSESERQALARLSVLPGAWQLEMGVAVLGGSPSVVPSLVRRSLIRFEAGRYRLLESTRQFMADQLSPEKATDVRCQLRRWLLALGEEAHPHLRGREQALWRDRLEQEYAHMVLALASAEADGDTVAAAELALVTWQYWQRRGGWRWLVRTLEAAQPSFPAERQTRLQITLAETRFGHKGCSDADAQKAAEAALCLCQAEGDTEGAARAELLLSRIAYYGDPVVSAAHAERATTLYSACRQELGVGDSHHIWGVAALRQGALSDAEEHYQIAREIFRRAGDQGAEAATEEGLAQVALQQERYDEAQRWGCAALERARNPLGEASLLFLLGEIARFKREGELAQSYYDRCDSLCTTLKLRALPGFVWRSQALVAAERGGFAEAERLFRAALEHFQEFHPPQSASTREDLAWLALQQQRPEEVRFWLSDRGGLRDPRALPDERRLAEVNKKNGPVH